MEYYLWIAFVAGWIAGTILLFLVLRWDPTKKSKGNELPTTCTRCKVFAVFAYPGNEALCSECYHKFLKDKEAERKKKDWPLNQD